MGRDEKIQSISWKSCKNGAKSTIARHFLVVLETIFGGKVTQGKKLGNFLLIDISYFQQNRKLCESEIFLVLHHLGNNILCPIYQKITKCKKLKIDIYR
jgi:hypothetical protein